VSQARELATTRDGRADSLAIARRVFGDERIQVLKDVLCRGMTDAQMEAFATVCTRTKLDPFARPPQIYPILRNSKNPDGTWSKVLTIVAGIDSFRLTAARTREYLGQVGPFWCGTDGVWKDVWLSEEHPKAARVGVLRKGFKEPIWSVAVWDRAAVYFNGKLGEFWERMGPEMLAKTAEANALKRGFPNDTEGLELAAIDAELREQQAAQAQRYTEIFGTEEDADDPLAAAQRRRALSASGQTVDVGTGEVLDVEGGAMQAAGPQSSSSVEDPTDKDMARLQELLRMAKRRGLVVESQPATGSGLGEAIRYWEDRITNHDLDQQAAKASAEGRPYA